MLQSLWTVNFENNTAIQGTILQSLRHGLCLCWWACGNILNSLNTCHHKGLTKYMKQVCDLPAEWSPHTDQNTFASHFIVRRTGECWYSKFLICLIKCYCIGFYSSDWLEVPGDWEVRLSYKKLSCNIIDWLSKSSFVITVYKFPQQVFCCT